GVYAFYDCESLESIKIPASVEKVGSYAFYDCSALKSAVFEGANTEIGIWGFAGCVEMTELALPENLERMNNHVLYKCSSLETVKIPETVTRIDGYALAGCEKLTEVNIPANVETVGEYAVGYGEGVLPVVDENVNIVSESPAIQEFCKENEVTINGEKPAKAEKLDISGVHDYLHGKKKISESQFNDADLNKDGVVNIYDWILIKKQNLTEKPQDPTGELETVPTEEPQYREGNIISETAVVSSGAGTDDVLATLKKGDAVRIISNVDNLFYVEYTEDGDRGFILQSNVAVAP
ncbi:MAG: leucine-rich repeat protein, partial [Oscillospiraceae bacterium]|nr:leucine-rich repeat protein [Oscillospiraceae bacterium]